MSDQTTPASGIAVNLIRLHDGTLIDPLTREPLKMMQPAKAENNVDRRSDGDSSDDVGDTVEVSDIDIQIRPIARRSVMDLALSKQQMAVINNILVYTVWGLPDDEIATQCNCTVHQVAVVRDLDDYKRMYDSLVEGLRAGYADTVHGLLAEAAPIAARGMVSSLASKSADIRMSARKDILDRAGFRPADKVEHTHNIGSGSELVIRIIKQNDADNVPTLDLHPNA